MGKPQKTLVNGKFMPVDGTVTGKKVAEAAGIEPGRSLLAVEEDGSSRLVHPDEKVKITEGMRFEDAPPASKG